jgi:hypothetical protein
MLFFFVFNKTALPTDNLPVVFKLHWFPSPPLWVNGSAYLSVAEDYIHQLEWWAAASVLRHPSQAVGLGNGGHSHPLR